MRAIRSTQELYAHAIAIEREAAERYGELAGRMADEGRDELATVFDMLARMEAEHLEALERRTDDTALPAIAPAQYQWLDAGAPETAARELIFRLMTPRQALAIALEAERRAQAFFERVFSTADDPALRALAREMAAEEQEHVALIERLLERTPENSLTSTLIFSR
ncbi:MAG TPA: ferritin family protein [Burkholderiales bacterium]|nr:ferritin family protein [Burkholderiales bacterium]